MDDDSTMKLCRTCGKKNFIFCDVQHEVLQKLTTFVPSLLDKNDANLPRDVCISCYQMIKTLLFNIEGIHDMQRILKIQFSGSASMAHQAPVSTAQASVENNRKRSLVDDITKKYKNIKLQKVSVNSSSQTKIDSLPALPIKPETSKLVSAEVMQEKQMSDNSLLRSDRPDAHRCFMCISCSEKFQNFTSLETHLKTCRASATKQFKCFCGKVLGSKKELSNHVTVEHKKNKQQHICPICKKVLSSLFNLQNHMMIHKKSPHATPKDAYMCHICKTKYPDLQGLQNHQINCKQKSSEA